MKKKDLFIPYQPYPKQAQFHRDPARYRLYGGAAGGGKSEALLMEAVIQSLEIKKNSGLLLRRTFPELEKTLIRRFLDKIPLELYKYNSSRHIVNFFNGSILEFGYCDREADVYKFQSAEYGFIGIDELTHFTEFQFKYLLSRLRSTNPKVFPNFFAGTNPGGPGHAWAKRLWIDRNFETNEIPEEYSFTQATVYDNPSLIENDPEYIKRLEALPELEKKALLEGNWDLFAGQYFKEFRKEIHICPFFNIPSDWRRFVCGDYGYSTPSAIYWCAINPDRQAFIYRELYEAGLTNRDLAQKIKALTTGDENVRYYVFDPSIFAKSGAAGEAGADVMKKEGLNIIAGDNNRIAGWAKFRDYLKPYTGQNGKQTAKLQIFETCPSLIRTLPQMIFDEHHPEDLDSRGEDHSVDAVRYGLMSLQYEGGGVRTRKRPRDPRLDPLYYWKVKRGIYQNIGPALY